MKHKSGNKISTRDFSNKLTSDLNSPSYLASKNKVVSLVCIPLDRRRSVNQVKADIPFNNSTPVNPTYKLLLNSCSTGEYPGT